MDRAWADELAEALGERYKVKIGQDAAEIHYRRRKTTYAATRFVLHPPTTLEVNIDIRIPKGTDRSEAEPFLTALEAQTMGPRGFTRHRDETTAMTNQHGDESGHVRSLFYRCSPATPAEAARRVRAINESVDIPIVIGIHDLDDVVAREPMKPPPKPQRGHDEPLDELRFRLIEGITHDLSAFVDLNTRTMKIVQRKMLASKQLGDTIKLAHLARIGTRASASSVALVVEKRDGSVIELASGPRNDAFIETARRLAKGVRIPFGDV